MLNENDRQQIEELVQKNPELRCLISKVLKDYKFNISKFSHELRNPIALISSSLQLIESQHPEVKDFKYWNDTMDDIQYVCCLLDELSTFNKCTSLNLSEYSISELLDSTCASICNNLNTDTRKFTTDYSESLPIITGDSIKIRQVITNLIKNAKDAVDPIHGIIHLNAYCLDDEHIQIQITDNGSGIPLENQDKIFEPFVTYKENGSGLGLSICRQIILLHKGTITFETKPDEGTTFTITLPIKTQV